MSAERVIATALVEQTYTEYPPDSNRTKYWDAYDPKMQGQPWCVAFLWWCFQQAGDRTAFMGGGKTASCTTLYRWYREQGLTVPIEQIQAGDIIFMNFSGSAELEHCGLVVHVIDGQYGWYRTIEGNTTPGLEGSQDNGGCVARKARHRQYIVAACRPMYTADKPADYEGHWAEPEIRRVIARGLMQGYEDGSFRPDKPITRAEVAVILDRLGSQR